MKALTDYHEDSLNEGLKISQRGRALLTVFFLNFLTIYISAVVNFFQFQLDTNWLKNLDFLITCFQIALTNQSFNS